MPAPTERVAQIEARIQQLENLLAPESATSVPKLSTSPLSKTPAVSKESFETALNRLTRNPDAIGLPPLPVTLQPAPGTVSAESLPLDADESRRRQMYLPYIREAAAATGLPETLIAAVIQAESSFKPETVSSAGAMGLMQLMPENVRELGVKDAFDPRENILAGARHLRDMVKRFGSLENALAAYNAGPGNVAKYHGIPPFTETRNYVQRITSLLQRAGALEGVQTMISGPATGASSRVGTDPNATAATRAITPREESGRFTQTLEGLSSPTRARRREEREVTPPEQGPVAPVVLPPPPSTIDPAAPVKSEETTSGVDARESTRPADADAPAGAQQGETAPATQDAEATGDTIQALADAEVSAEPRLFSASLDRRLPAPPVDKNAGPTTAIPGTPGTAGAEGASSNGATTGAPGRTAGVQVGGVAISELSGMDNATDPISVTSVESQGADPVAASTIAEKPAHSGHATEAATADATPDVAATPASETTQATAPGADVNQTTSVASPASADEAAAELAEVAARLREGVRGRAPGEKVVLRVAPKTLGAMELHVERALDGGLNVRVVTETRQAAELLQREQGPLTEALAQNGLSLNAFSTALSDQRSDLYREPAVLPTQIASATPISSPWTTREPERLNRTQYGRLDFHA